MKKLLNLKIDGSTQKECIDITATGLEFNQYVLDEEDGFCDKIQFGEIYYGKIEQKRYYLLNNSPERVEFKSLIMKGNLS